MEEDQKLKHVCKLCNKSFPCGRSLGGHMRSHVINSADQTAEKLNKKKLSSANNGGSNANANTETGIQEGGTHIGYGLRENPKKTCRFADSSGDTLLHTKLCKDCGKSFQSWKALFGHMKCHSERVSTSVEEESWTSATRKPVMDTQSDNEVAVPSRRKRSSRTVATRYTTTTTSSSFSIANASSSASEIEQEQEEVAMCLMMLSRDVGHWSGLNSAVESSDNNSEFLDARSSIQTNGVARIVGKINSLCDGAEIVKLKRQINGKSESSILDSENSQFDEKQSEIVAAGFSGNGPEMNKLKASVKNGLLPNGKCEVELKKDLVNENGFDQAELGSKKHGSSKRKCRDLFDPHLGVVSSSKLSCGGGFGTEMQKGSEKRNRFECTTCNKTFHSYQALGGHRASHKKLKPCSASKIDSSETSIKTKASPDPNVNTKLIEALNNEDFNDHESKKSKGHECPICFKVFSSGQALGGHKRSHMSGGTEARSSQSIDIQRPIPEIRDLLDLNLPAPAEEESNGNVGFNPLWVGSNGKHDPLVSLLSN